MTSPRSLTELHGPDAQASRSGTVSAHVPLGVGSLIASSFEILFSRPLAFLLLGFLGIFAGYMLYAIAEPGLRNLAPGARGFIEPLHLSQLVLLSFSLVTAMGARLTLGIKQGSKVALHTSLVAAIRGILPNILLTMLLAALLIALPGASLAQAAYKPQSAETAILGLLISPFVMTWIGSIFCVMIPAIVIDRAGLRAMQRSAALTKDYRLPLAGLILVMLCIAFFILTAALFVAFFASREFLDLIPLVPIQHPITRPFVYAASFSLVMGAGLSLLGITSTLIHIRLREIKEGFGAETIAEVFD